MQHLRTSFLHSCGFHCKIKNGPRHPDPSIQHNEDTPRPGRTAGATQASHSWSQPRRSRSPHRPQPQPTRPWAQSTWTESAEPTWRQEAAAQNLRGLEAMATLGALVTTLTDAIIYYGDRQETWQNNFAKNMADFVLSQPLRPSRGATTGNTPAPAAAPGPAAAGATAGNTPAPAAAPGPAAGPDTAEGPTTAEAFAPTPGMGKGDAPAPGTGKGKSKADFDEI